MSVVDLSFVDRLDESRVRRIHHAEAVRESLRQKMKFMHNHAEGALDYARDLIRVCHEDATEELKEFEAFATSMLLVVAMLKRQATPAVSECVQTQPERN